MPQVPFVPPGCLCRRHCALIHILPLKAELPLLDKGRPPTPLESPLRPPPQPAQLLPQGVRPPDRREDGQRLHGDVHVGRLGRRVRQDVSPNILADRVEQPRGQMAAEEEVARGRDGRQDAGVAGAEVGLDGGPNRGQACLLLSGMEYGRGEGELRG